MSFTRQQYTLMGLFALFFLPLILVMLMRSSFWDYRPAHLKNNGELVHPPLSLQIDEALKGEWLLTYVAPVNCDTSCLHRIAALRQIYLASGRQQEHLRVLVLNAGQPNPELAKKVTSIFADIIYIDSVPAGVLNSIQSLNADLQNSSGNPTERQTYILDPLQNVVLAYKTDTNPSDINKDLKQLLKWSKADNMR